MATQIAQLLIPSDGRGAPQFAVADWINGRIFLGSTTALRVYTAAMATQSPIASVTAANAFASSTFSDADPLTGNLILADGAGVVTNYAATTLATVASYNAGTVIEGAVCASCGTAASGGAVQRGYAAIKQSIFSGSVDVIFTDTMTTAGALLGVVSGSVNNRGTLWRGASGPAGASIFAMGNNYGASPLTAYPIWRIDILPGAESHTSSNPFITVSSIGSVSGAAIDPTWTTFTVDQHGYDRTDGNLLLYASTANAATHQHYVVKVSSTTAAVIWATPLVPLGTFLPGYNVTRHGAAFLPSGAGDVITTSTGVLTTTALSGLSSVSSVMSDDASGLILLDAAYASGAGAPVAVSGTASSFTGFALLGGLLIPPDFPLSGVVKVLLPPAELQFCDAIGAPYAGGTLEFYEQNTTTPKDTWNSPLGGDDHLNSNPLVLDSAGRALIYGDGAYRTVLRDAAGNLIWDQPSFTYVSACMVPVVGAADLATARQAMGITDAIEAEALARAAADSAEASAWASADATLQSNIDAETARAEAAEAALGARIDGLPAPAPPGNTQGAGGTLDAAGHARVTFGTPFATDAISVVITGEAVGVWSGAFNVANLDRFGFDVWGSIFGSRTPASGIDFYWLAIGD
jgi:hypothetical protein